MLSFSYNILILFAIFNCNSVHSTCPSSSFFDCGNDRCIAHFWRCDGEDDCGNWADEHNCLNAQNNPIIKDCPTGQFACNDSRSTCVPHKWICDGMSDCPNGNDEMNCTKDSVQCDGYLCHNLECVPKRWRCDGIPDCDDQSDEMNCTQTKTQICDKEHGFYQCLTGECIDHFKVCDNHKDCLHGDDEGIECKSNGCHTKGCTQLCFIAPEGPQCYCREGFIIGKDNKTCMDKNECLDNRKTGLCSQTCSNLDGGYKCGCFDDYKLINNKSCVVKEGEPLLLFTNTEGIRGLWLRDGRFFPVYHSLKKTIGLDFLGSEERVFWVDLDKTHSGVYSVGLTGEDFKTVVTNGLKSPEDIAIDWIGENFYITDGELNRIIVCRLIGNICSSTLFGNLDQPRSVVVDPSQGLIFWTQWGDKKPGVFKAGMDGSNIKHIVSQEIVWPNGLAHDSVANRLYWTEAKIGKLEFLDLETNQRTVVLKDKIFHPFSIDVFEEWMYWSDWVTYSLERSHKVSGHNQTTLLKEMNEQIMGVHIFHPLKQKSSYNPCWYHTCSHICVLAPNRQFTCVCPDHMTLSKDNQTCIGKPNNPFLLVGAHQGVQLLFSEAIGNDVMIDLFIPKGVLIGDIAFDWNSKTLYIYDSKKLAIGSIELEDPINEHWIPLITSDLDRVHGLTYDSHTNQLYWLETQKGILEVSTTDGKSRTLILKDLDKPIDLVLHPEHRRMYVAVMGNNPQIIVADMDGDNLKVLVSSKNGFAVSLAIDKLHERLYWADAKNGVIEWLDLLAPKSHSSHRIGVAKRNLGHVMSIAVHNKTLFWTDMDSDIVYHETLDKESARHSKVNINVEHSGKIEKRLLMAFPETTAHGPCITAKGGCSHICLLGRYGSTCKCPFGYNLKSDGQSCEKDSEETDNSVVCSDCVTSDHNSDDFSFIALENSDDEDLHWLALNEDEEADVLFSQYDSKHTINESHNVNVNNDSLDHLMTTQTDVTTVSTIQTTISSTQMTTKAKKRKQNSGNKKNKMINKTEDSSNNIREKNSTKVIDMKTSKTDSAEIHSTHNSKSWLTIFVAVLVVLIITLLIFIIIKRDDYREVRNVIYSRGDRLRGAIVRFQNPLFRKTPPQYDEEEPLNCDNKSLNEEKY